ncbi:MAG: hypothetical protein ACI8U3_000190 [Brevundimonas sp.]|jgi:hypothetical protein|uniref:hypothetical protein n=1 Tax=Brevundimonas sp. TaxID=1871086 RepID=UPI0039E2C703
MADAVEAARARIDRALNDLERKVRELKARPAPIRDDDLFAPRPGDGAETGNAARVAELETAADEASKALSRAADEVRAMLNGED